MAPAKGLQQTSAGKYSFILRAKVFFMELQICSLPAVSLVVNCSTAESCWLGNGGFELNKIIHQYENRNDFVPIFQILSKYERFIFNYFFFNRSGFLNYLRTRWSGSVGKYCLFGKKKAFTGFHVRVISGASGKNWSLLTLYLAGYRGKYQQV